MILEYKLDLRTKDGIYERIFLRTLEEMGLSGKVLREHFNLQMFVEADDAEALEQFADTLAASLPHSIYLRDTKVTAVESMPEAEGLVLSELTEDRMIPFCPQCASRVLDTENAHYYDIHTQCDVCGYGVDDTEPRSWREELLEHVMTLQGGGVVKLATRYGTLYLGMLERATQDEEYDILVHDLAVMAECAYIQEHDVMALGAIEKPFVRLRTLPDFTTTLPWENNRLVRFKLPDNMTLYLLMEELHHLGIDRLFISTAPQPYQSAFEVITPLRETEPIEVIVSGSDLAIVGGDKGLPDLACEGEPTPVIGSFYSVLREHRIDHENVAGVHLDREEGAHILVHGRKYGTVGYLAFEDEAAGMATLFRRIVESDESGKKIVENYQKAHPERFAQLLGIAFDHPRLSLYRLWGVVSLVLGLSEKAPLEEAAATLEREAILFDGVRGPRIDYRIYNDEGNVQFDPLMTIRTAMSFHLAGVDPDEISYGVVESFCEFLGTELDQVEQSMGTEGITLSGSLLTNGRLFAKITEELSLNHTIYLNNQLPVHGRNVLYGGTDPLSTELHTKSDT